jgi:hypothetical protein
MSTVPSGSTFTLTQLAGKSQLLNIPSIHQPKRTSSEQTRGQITTPIEPLDMMAQTAGPGQMEFDSSELLSEPQSTWASFHPAFNQPSCFPDLQRSDFDDPGNNGSTYNTWRISTKLNAPITNVNLLDTMVQRGELGQIETDSSELLSEPQSAWAPFRPAFSQSPRFTDLQTSGFNDLQSNPSYNNPSYNKTCWQNQPSIYAWQISTKLKAPATIVDQLMFSMIHSQRHLAVTLELTGEDLLGPSLPSVNLLFNQPESSKKKPSNLTEVMARYSAVLSRQGFALIPEKLAYFMCMYRFVQWQISPNYETYQKLHEWQAPRPLQLMVPHPAWMDFPPWGKFREKVIENQDKYDNIEFQSDYAINFSVNFPHDSMKALIF